MEKFSLKWNDFETHATNSFRNLRKEEQFFDVALVSDDQQLVSAHKLVLSASSEFFNNILKKSTHSNPLIYLPGVQSVYLNFVLDYIYDGEVQLYQDNLDSFLDVAQKLKIEGLIGNPREQKQQGYANDDEMPFNAKETSELNSIVKNEVFRSNPQRTNFDEYENSISLVDQDYSKEELAKIVDDLIVKDGDMYAYACKSCGKSAKSRSQIKIHVESHIEGLSFPCELCENTFRSRNILKHHKQRQHKNVSNISNQ